ncbi:MAG: ATP-binding protein, partial [Bernardetiaceae bacterium]|nr:ATP-binding protein [Bernardetiaceae bacterium]
MSYSKLQEMMRKEFNITGTCHADEHYMMDDSRRFAGIIDFVERGKYFVINRPRQYGKTTMLFALMRELDKREDYLPIKMDFQGMPKQAFKSEDFFSELFWRDIVRAIDLVDNEFATQLSLLAPLTTFAQLSARLTELCKSTPKKLVLLIDEVDAGSNYDTFLNFLALLRDRYFTRKLVTTFHSVVLAGVHDIKSLKFKLRNPEDAQYNSPWNIATDFEVEMEFYPEEIAFMLRQYSEAENVKMDIDTIADKLYYYTSGYPFLVSKLCKNIAERILPKRKDQNQWTLDDIEESVQLLLKENNTNFDSLIKNLENNEDLYRLVEAILLEGYKMPYDPHVSSIRLGETYGIFKGNGIIKIHNRVYEQVIYNYMTNNRLAKSIREQQHNFRDTYLGTQFTKDDGSLDLETVLRKFQAFMKEQYSKKDNKMLEREWRLIFLAFLKPILNG